MNLARPPQKKVQKIFCGLFDVFKPATDLQDKVMKFLFRIMHMLFRMCLFLDEIVNGRGIWQ